jgi:hypothetical protein
MLDAGTRSAGAHAITIDATSLASGVYHCRLAVDGRLIDSPITVVR